MSGLEIEGEYTSADVKTDEVDEATVEQIEEIVDHEAFRNDVRIMPDAHKGAGTVVGFTMPLGNRVPPNTVGVDIGCGMTAYSLGEGAWSREDAEEIDSRIRERVPMGRETFGDRGFDHGYHLVNDFPWDDCERKLSSLDEALGIGIESPGYGKGYFMNLCERVGESVSRVIYSLGTLGGGNHFIEVSESSETGEHWVVVHSGSRGIGLSIAEYWQERAHEACDDRPDAVRDMLEDIDPRYYKFDLDEVSDEGLLNRVLGGMGEDWKDMDSVRDIHDGEPERIDEVHGQLVSISEYAVENADGSPLDYLEGDEREGYLVDMVFAQTYAEENRRLICDAVAEVLDGEVRDTINSTHNYIDFDDLVIRKGATSVHEGERGVIPFDMSRGSVIVEGKGNDDWNSSAPHGSGRRGSRRWAHDEFDLDSFERSMEGVFSTSVKEETLDECPGAYKDADVVLERIDETAEVVDSLRPVHAIKADG